MWDVNFEDGHISFEVKKEKIIHVLEYKRDMTIEENI